MIRLPFHDDRKVTFSLVFLASFFILTSCDDATNIITDMSTKYISSVKCSNFGNSGLSVAYVMVSEDVTDNTRHLVVIPSHIFGAPFIVTNISGDTFDPCGADFDDLERDLNATFECTDSTRLDQLYVMVSDATDAVFIGPPDGISDAEPFDPILYMNVPPAFADVTNGAAIRERFSGAAASIQKGAGGSFSSSEFDLIFEDCFDWIP